MFLEACIPLLGLLIFGNIENLILASQGVVAGVNPIKLLLHSLLCVIIWLIVGTLTTSIATQYANIIEIIGGLAIMILGAQSMIEVLRGR